MEESSSRYIISRFARFYGVSLCAACAAILLPHNAGKSVTLALALAALLVDVILFFWHPLQENKHRSDDVRVLLGVFGGLTIMVVVLLSVFDVLRRPDREWYSVLLAFGFVLVGYVIMITGATGFPRISSWIAGKMTDDKKDTLHINAIALAGTALLIERYL